MQKRLKAFTLIELLVVIAIIGILSGFIFVSLNGAINSAKDAKRKADLSSVETALLSYGAQHGGTYPTGSGTPCNLTGSTNLCPTLASDLSPYVSNLPPDPNSSSYTYTGVSDGSSFSLGGTLSNAHAYSYSSISSVWTESNPALVCPSVGGTWTDTGLGFCVQTYEAMNVGNLPISQSSNPNTPWSTMSGEANCQALACGGAGCHLLTNAQKTLIDTNLNSVSANVVSGHLLTGWRLYNSSGNPPRTTADCAYAPSLAGTCAAAPSPAGSFDQSRVLAFSNGGVVWDYRMEESYSSSDKEMQFAYWLLEQDRKYNIIPVAEAIAMPNFRCSYAP